MARRDAEKGERGGNVGKLFPERADTLCLSLCACISVCAHACVCVLELMLGVGSDLDTKYGGKMPRRGIDRILKNVINS